MVLKKNKWKNVGIHCPVRNCGVIITFRILENGTVTSDGEYPNHLETHSKEDLITALCYESLLHIVKI